MRILVGVSNVRSSRVHQMEEPDMFSGIRHTTGGSGHRTSGRLIALVAIAFAATTVFATGAQASHRRCAPPASHHHGHGIKISIGHGHSYKKPYRPSRRRPNCHVSDYQRGYRAGSRRGYRTGYDDGLTGSPYCATPRYVPSCSSPAFRRGYCSGYQRSYSSGYHKGRRDRYRRGYCR